MAAAHRNAEIVTVDREKGIRWVPTHVTVRVPCDVSVTAILTETYIQAFTRFQIDCIAREPRQAISLITVRVSVFVHGRSHTNTVPELPSLSLQRVFTGFDNAGSCPLRLIRSNDHIHRSQFVYFEIGITHLWIQRANAVGAWQEIP